MGRGLKTWTYGFSTLSSSSTSYFYAMLLVILRNMFIFFGFSSDDYSFFSCFLSSFNFDNTFWSFYSTRAFCPTYLEIASNYAFPNGLSVFSRIEVIEARGLLWLSLALLLDWIESIIGSRLIILFFRRLMFNPGDWHSLWLYWSFFCWTSSISISFFSILIYSLISAVCIRYSSFMVSYTFLRNAS